MTEDADRDSPEPHGDSPSDPSSAARVACLDCDGTGRVDGGECPTCDGRGVVEEMGGD